MEDGREYDTLTEVLSAQEKEFGLLDAEKHEKLAEEKNEEEAEKRKGFNKWGFITADGTRYDTLTEMIQARAEKFGY